jgi:hypothetical protein
MVSYELCKPITGKKFSALEILKFPCFPKKRAELLFEKLGVNGHSEIVGIVPVI